MYTIIYKFYCVQALLYILIWTTVKCLFTSVKPMVDSEVPYSVQVAILIQYTLPVCD